jgi:hypothetical protein
VGDLHDDVSWVRNDYAGHVVGRAAPARKAGTLARVTRSL